MREMKPVSVKFSLGCNEKIVFSSLMRTGRMRKPDTGCVSDIIFLDLYVDETGMIRIPDAYEKEWIDNIRKMQEIALKWKTAVRPQIKKLTQILQDQSELIMKSLNNIISITDSVIHSLKNGRETGELYFKFSQKIMELLCMFNTQSEFLNDFQILLNDYSYHLTEVNKQLESLSMRSDNVTEEQKQQLDKIKNDLKNYQRSRKSAIADACVNGVIPSARIVGGTMKVSFPNKTDIFIGAACFFGGTISETGMGIATFEAISLKNKITAVKKKQINAENERMVKEIIETQFGILSELTGNLTKKVRAVCDDRTGMLSAVRNIGTYTQSAKGALLPDEWEVLRHDLTVIQTVINISDKTAAESEGNTNICTGYHLTGCRTQKEMIGKLKAFAGI